MPVTGPRFARCWVAGEETSTMTIDEPPTERSAVTGATDERIEYEWTDSVLPSTAVVEAIAAATDRDHTELPPLYEYVEVDALDTLVTATTDHRVDVSFTYDGVRVRISSVGRVDIRPDGAGTD